MSIDDAENVAVALGLDDDGIEADELNEDDEGNARCQALKNGVLAAAYDEEEVEDAYANETHEVQEDELDESSKTTGNAWIDYLIDG